MDAEVFKKIQPKAFYGQYLENEVRPDGRGVDDARGILISYGHIGTADGSSLVRIGGTGVICGLKLSFDPAKESSDTKGSLDVNIILSSLCNADFFYGEQDKQSKYYAQVLKQIFQRYVLDLNELYSADTSTVICVHASIICIDYEGSILDACCLALLSALLTLRVPKLSLKEKELVYDYDAAYPLTILDYPVAVTFGLYSEFEVMDPDAFEEGLLDDTITVVLGGNNKTISIIKPGGKRISDTLVMTLRGKAAKRYGTVYESVEKFKCDLLTNMKEKCAVCCL